MLCHPTRVVLFDGAEAWRNKNGLGTRTGMCLERHRLILASRGPSPRATGGPMTNRKSENARCTQSPLSAAEVFGLRRPTPQDHGKPNVRPSKKKHTVHLEPREVQRKFWASGGPGRRKQITAAASIPALCNIAQMQVRAIQIGSTRHAPDKHCAPEREARWKLTSDRPPGSQVTGPRATR